MKKDKEQSSFVNIGSSSLLIVFLVLCLATFAILSLSSAKSDYTLSERLADHKSQYYEASAKAETVLGEIDAVLEETASQKMDFHSSRYIKAVTEEFDNAQIEGASVSCNFKEDELIISYQIPAGEKQALDVELLVTDYTKNENYYEIKKWQINSTGTWEGDNSLNLMPIGEQ